MEIIQQTIEGELITVNFNYATLTQENQIFLQSKENEIKGAVNNIAKEFMTIGRSLLEAKERLPHGHFEQWVEGNLPFKIRMAQEMMNVARDPKAHTYALLGFNFSVQKQLAAPSTPNEVKTTVIAQAEAGETITTETVKAIKISNTMNFPKGIRYCPNCNHAQELILSGGHYKKCDQCKTNTFKEEWLFKPKAVEAANGQQPTAEQVKKAATNTTPGPAAQWLEKQKTHELTTPMYCPSCNKPQEVLTTWLTNENIMKRGLLKCEQCEKSMNLITWQKNPQTNTRHCPDCNHEQKLTDKAIEYNNEVQCSNCKSHARTKGWLTEPGEPWKHCTSCHAIWRNQNGLQHRDYSKPEQLQIYQCTEETCPICEKKAKQKAKAEKPYYPRPETAINFLIDISPEMAITINQIDISIADPGFKYEIINHIYEKITQSYEPDILGELADTW